jgi:hypothetical protein
MDAHINFTGGSHLNKQDLAALRKEFKVDGSYLEIKQIYSVFMQAQSREVIHREGGLFEMKDDEVQELFIGNYKKMLTGGLDSKIFELRFNPGEDDEAGQKLLCGFIKNESIEELAAVADKVIAKITDVYSYESDVLISFIKAQYRKAYKNKENNMGATDDGMGFDDTQYAHEFIMCSINKVTTPKRVLRFDNMGFSASSALEIVVNLDSPLEGFMFPAFTDNMTDVNSVIYYTSKANQRNLPFIESVLDCTCTLSASEEKEKFDEIIKAAVGEKAKSETIKGIYEQINEAIAYASEEEIPTVNMRAIETILHDNGVETEAFETLYTEIAGGNLDFKASNIIPEYSSKSLKIETTNANIAISPQNLNVLKMVTDSRGVKCLLIEVGEDVEINGVILATEPI